MDEAHYKVQHCFDDLKGQTVEKLRKEQTTKAQNATKSRTKLEH